MPVRMDVFESQQPDHQDNHEGETRYAFAVQSRQFIGRPRGSYCAGCIAGPATAGAGGASNTARACRICSSALITET
jgi:hypothetical protein